MARKIDTTPADVDWPEWLFSCPDRLDSNGVAVTPNGGATEWQPENLTVDAEYWAEYGPEGITFGTRIVLHAAHSATVRQWLAEQNITGQRYRDERHKRGLGRWG